MQNNKEVLRLAEQAGFYWVGDTEKELRTSSTEGYAELEQFYLLASRQVPVSGAVDEREAWELLWVDAVNNANISAADFPAEVVRKLRGALWQARAALQPAQTAPLTDERKLLQEICDMQAKKCGDGSGTHMALIGLADKARALLSHPAAPARPQGFDAEFLSKRLARVAKLAGVPMPDMPHEQVAEVAGTILGKIANKLEAALSAPAAQQPSLPVSEQSARHAIDGAIEFGRAGSKPPIDGHWLMPYWQIGRQLAQQPSDRDKLLMIIACAYQIVGVHDAPEHILDVLSDPENATDEQIDAMLPYQILEQPSETAIWNAAIEAVKDHAKARYHAILAACIVNELSELQRPAAQEAEKPQVQPIPAGVYYGAYDNFYNADTNEGMGTPFYEQWRDRIAEFPLSPEAAREQPAKGDTK